MRKRKIDYTKFHLEDKDVMHEAVMRCYREMYKRAQPSADFDKLMKQYNKEVEELVDQGMKKDEAKRKCTFYERYYLSHNEFCYIVDKYLKAYRFNTVWDDHMQLIINEAKNGYSDEVYEVPKWDPKGEKQRHYIDRQSIEKQIKKLLKFDFTGWLSKKLSELFIGFLENRKWYYRFNMDENQFRGATALGGSPTSNEDTVKEYWASQGIEINIDLREYSKDYFYSEEFGDLDEYLEYWNPDGSRKEGADNQVGTEDEDYYPADFNMSNIDNNVHD